ncbi:MAG: sodium-translocating pyrophosphatase [Nitrospirota bacterium]
MEQGIIIFAAICGAAGVLYGILTAAWVVKQEKGTARMQEIAAAIREGAQAFLSREYRTVALVGIFIFVLIGIFLHWIAAFGFLLGAAGSATAGYVGMMITVRGNLRTSQAAYTSLRKALRLAFRGGSVAGLLVVGLALLSIAVYYSIAKAIVPEKAFYALVGLGFGCSLMSVFARIAGGIYTKAADVGADLVGKVEAGIPEDDPRNPAVIADQVGDNVGDCAGMAADLYETYIVTIVAAMLLGKTVFGAESTWAFFPLLLGGISIIASIVGTFFVRLGAKQYIMGALYKGLAASGILAAIAFYFVSIWFIGKFLPDSKEALAFTPWTVLLTAGVGLLATGLMMAITEFFTSKGFGPVKLIAKASTTGPATNIIAGLSVSMRSTMPPALVVVGAILASYALGGGFAGKEDVGLYAIGLAAAAMLSMTGIVVAIDSYGPVTDNAAGIAEMSQMDEKVRGTVLDPLDAVGNTTKAVTKGYAITSAGLCALVLFAEYSREFLAHGIELHFKLANPLVLSGLFIGALLPFYYGSRLMLAVGKAAGGVVEEVRRQFREIAGIMEGKAKPQYGQCVDIVTKGAIKEMIIPSLLPVVSPVLVGFILGKEALGAMLIGVILTGLFLAIAMTSGGGAWDNAKKFIEEGMYGGKKSDAHKAAVTGDTVGDPYKDTAGPAMNPMIKVVNIVALLIVPLLV